MDFSMGSAGESGGGGGRRGRGGNNQDPRNSSNGKRTYHRHTAYQTAQLDAFFKECPHPDENQRRHLGRELGLEPRQVKFWFQNKRTQTKTQNERLDNTILRADNERMQSENLAIREALMNIACPSCGGPPFGEEEHMLHLQKLQQENAQLKEEHERIANLLARYFGKPMSHLQLLAPALGSSLDPSAGSSLNNRIESPGLDIDFGSVLAISDDDMLPNLMGEVTEMEKEIMVEAATSAMDELVKLLRINEPLWVESPDDGKFILHRDSYEEIFSKTNHFRSSSARVESSKESRMVCMTGQQLVDVFLDSDKWVDLFPTIVTKARTVEVLESGSLGNRTGALQLMYEEMHILSPLVPPREFYFLRHCQQVEVGVWVIADVSFDSLRDNIPISCTWKLPSGCMIHEMPNGFSQVTWVEHVEVSDKPQTHRLYRDLVCSNFAYGAERWVVTLQRMCERFAYSLDENIPSDEAQGVISLPEGRRSVMNLAHRMVKDFCGILNMSGKLDFPHLSEMHNSGVRVSVRKNTEPGQPDGMIVSAATSLWLPVPHQNVFNFFKDEKRRVQWDVLSYGNPEHEIAHISNGIHPGNCISVIRPFIPTENNVLILQETCTDSLGSLVVYAPLDVPSINMVVRGEDSSMVQILPSGFVISGDGRDTSVAGASTSADASELGGSLLTVAFQILACSSSAIRQLNMESVATINTLISSTVQKIKVALNCAGGD